MEEEKFLAELFFLWLAESLTLTGFKIIIIWTQQFSNRLQNCSSQVIVAATEEGLKCMVRRAYRAGQRRRKKDQQEISEIARGC